MPIFCTFWTLSNHFEAKFDFSNDFISNHGTVQQELMERVFHHTRVHNASLKDSKFFFSGMTFNSNCSSCSSCVIAWDSLKAHFHRSRLHQPPHSPSSLKQLLRRRVFPMAFFSFLFAVTSTGFTVILV